MFQSKNLEKHRVFKKSCDHVVARQLVIGMARILPGKRPIFQLEVEFAAKHPFCADSFRDFVARDVQQIFFEAHREARLPGSEEDRWFGAITFFGPE